MPKKKYFKILGLPPTATEGEIRKRYRMLAMKHHPDKTSDSNSHEKFVELTEAYEILLNRKTIPKKHKIVTEEEKEKKKEERIRAAKKRYQEQRIKEHLENERYYQKLTNGRKWQFIKVLAFVGVLLSTCLIADKFLPHHYEEDAVTHYAKNVGYGPNGQIISLIKMESDRKFWISRLTYSLHSKTRLVYIESSWIFHNPIRIISKDKLFQKYFDIHFSFYGASYLMIFFFLIPSFTIFYKRKKISFTFLFYLSYYGISGLMLLFLFTGNRWAHFLTAGFL